MQSATCPPLLALACCKNRKICRVIRLCGVAQGEILPQWYAAAAEFNTGSKATGNSQGFCQSSLTSIVAIIHRNPCALCPTLHGPSHSVFVEGGSIYRRPISRTYHCVRVGGSRRNRSEDMRCNSIHISVCLVASVRT